MEQAERTVRLTDNRARAATAASGPSSPTSADPLVFYARQSPISDPRSLRSLFDGLPRDLLALCRTVRGLVLHPATAHLYGVEVERSRLAEQDTRDVASILARIRQLDPAPLTVARPPERRFVGCCRDFSVMLCAMLRHQGVPARARAGCARYFAPGFNVDHWICEIWRPAGSTVTHTGRWVMVDAQLDEAHCQHYGIAFDPHDLPPEQFLAAGDTWRRCRSGEAAPETFGVTPGSPVRGWRYLQSQLVRDVAALNRMELLCWDLWGLADAREAATGADLALLDRLAELTLAGRPGLDKLRSLYEGDARLRVPPVITSLESASGWQTARQVSVPTPSRS